MKPSLTILTATCADIDRHAWAVTETAWHVPKDRFSRITQMVFSPTEPGRALYSGGWCKIASWQPYWRSAYNIFMQSALATLTDTDFVITCQSDGFAMHGSLWDDEFLEYDYIGAPWPWWVRLASRHSPSLFRAVGNGGFSLRSRKWLEFGMYETPDARAEDVSACRTHIKERLAAGLRVAPVRVARKWAIEYPMDRRHIMDNCFGFHGRTDCGMFLGQERLFTRQVRHFLKKLPR